MGVLALFIFAIVMVVLWMRADGQLIDIRHALGMSSRDKHEDVLKVIKKMQLPPPTLGDDSDG